MQNSMQVLTYSVNPTPNGYHVQLMATGQISCWHFLPTNPVASSPPNNVSLLLQLPIFSGDERSFKIHLRWSMLNGREEMSRTPYIDHSNSTLI
ncbi:hypothetical protein BDD12DRAFT_867636 [Trichophaea hybrida]|nr:hypothetical protein BDD12DRAFT_867636 [Trichophaea hybrida]